MAPAGCCVAFILKELFAELCKQFRKQTDEDYKRCNIYKIIQSFDTTLKAQDISKIVTQSSAIPTSFSNPGSNLNGRAKSARERSLQEVPVGKYKRSRKSDALTPTKRLRRWVIFPFHACVRSRDFDEEMNESCSKINEVLDTYYLTTFYSIEFILGLIGNVIVISGYIFCLKEWKCSNIYLFNLSISDLVFICTLPMFVAYYANDKEWIFGGLLCKLNRYILYTNMYLSMLFLACISIDRYLLVSNPMRIHMFQKKKVAIVICIALWIFVTLEVLPMLTFIGVTAHDNNTVIKCVDYASAGNAIHNLIYNVCLTVVGFLLPMCIMGVFCVKTAHMLKKLSQDRTRSVTLEKPLTLVILAIVIFSTFFTPYHIMRNVRMVSRLENITLSDCTVEGIKAAYTISRPVAFLSIITNSVFYFLSGDKFREIITSRIKSRCLRKPR
ncbi:succinate receptor 1-like [Mustelus asterias]